MGECQALGVIYLDEVWMPWSHIIWCQERASCLKSQACTSLNIYPLSQYTIQVLHSIREYHNLACPVVIIVLLRDFYNKMMFTIRLQEFHSVCYRDLELQQAKLQCFKFTNGPLLIIMKIISNSQCHIYSFKCGVGTSLYTQRNNMVPGWWLLTCTQNRFMVHEKIY